MTFSRGPSQPRDQSQVSCTTHFTDSLLIEQPRKPKNTGVGSLSLFQGIFLTQESKWGLLHCRWIFLPTELMETNKNKTKISLLEYVYLENV